MKKAMVAVLLTLFLFGTVSMLACASSKDTRENTFSVGSNPVVEVEVGNGNVDLVLGTAGQIIVVAKLHKPESVEYEVSQEGDSITVDVNTRRGSKADMTLTVPENTRFILSTGSGSVNVPAIQASGQVNSGSGPISLEKIKGDVIVNAGSGNITVSGVSGSFIMNAGSGNIVLSDSTGSFIVSSGSGKVDVLESKGTFDLSSGSGDVEFQGELAQGSDNRFSSGSGSITAELMGSPSVELDLEIEDGGKPRVDLPITVREQSEYRLIGTIGDGEASLTVHTGSGNITIK
jgi:DUF4097 and DUF4098 domain-containing protein YvlB